MTNPFPYTPVCPVYDVCGGCQYQHLPYDEELKEKEAQLKGLFGGFNLPDAAFAPILASPQEYHYRNRLDLKLLKTKADSIHIGFSPPKGFKVVEISACPIARQEISDAIPRIKEEAAAVLPPDYRLANLTIRSGDEKAVSWGGIGRHSLRMQAADYFWTEIRGRRIYYSLDTFFQANLFILPSLIERMRGLKIWTSDALFFDLYGGVGLFGLCFADLVRKVYLIEESASSLTLARYNAAKQGLTNFEIHDGKVEKRLPPILEAHPDEPKIMMIDPPRCGLSPSVIKTLNAVSQVETLLYLSCNPKSLVENLKGLSARWAISEVHPLDFFPRTRHLETLVVLKHL